MELSNTSALSPELLAQIKQLHFQTRRLADEGIVGQYKSAFRGRGVEFEEVREYVPGDDVRSIDWKVTARSGRPFIKRYREERELTVIIAVDVSASTLTGTRCALRSSLVAQTAAVLTLIALRNNDKVGLVTFSDRIETFHPPRKARGAVWRILHEVLQPASYHPRTDIGEILTLLNQLQKRSSIVFLISDFISPPFQTPLAILARGHDVTSVVVTDPSAYRLPETKALVQTLNPETGEISLIDCADRNLRELYEAQGLAHRQSLSKTFASCGVKTLEIRTDRPLMPVLRQYFLARGQAQSLSWAGDTVNPSSALPDISGPRTTSSGKV